MSNPKEPEAKPEVKPEPKAQPPAATPAVAKPAPLDPTRYDPKTGRAKFA